ncbi:MAG TPA: hypothetical protein VE033_16330 [Acetobacteraceae bacterium]|nr:hypothetical protein [Acetobacteraceae bacterium]
MSALLLQDPSAFEAARSAAVGRRSAAYLFADLDPPAPEPEVEPEPDPLPGLLDEAWRGGYAQGHAEGHAAAQASIEAHAAAVLDATLAALAEADRAARDVAEQSALAMGEACIAALLATLPSLSPRFAAEEALRFAEALLPALSEEPVVTLRVAPVLAPAIAARFAREARVEVLADEAVAPGDTVATWRGGRAEHRADAARNAIAGAFAALGLS